MTLNTNFAGRSEIASDCYEISSVYNRSPGIFAETIVIAKILKGLIYF